MQQHAGGFFERGRVAALAVQAQQTMQRNQLQQID